MRTIIGVAIRIENKVYSLFAPKRHKDVLQKIDPNVLIDCKYKYIEGFIDNEDNFLNGFEARNLAVENGQYKPFKFIKKKQYYCYSENLW